MAYRLVGAREQRHVRRGTSRREAGLALRLVLPVERVAPNRRAGLFLDLRLPLGVVVPRHEEEAPLIELRLELVVGRDAGDAVVEALGRALEQLGLDLGELLDDRRLDAFS